jgi:RimJ/RimL family protein N-acetyltransferase
MKVEKISYNSKEFQKVKKDAPKNIIIFNEKAIYYCLRIDNKIVSICGAIKYKEGIKLISWFTYLEYRNKGYMLSLLLYVIEKYKGLKTYAMCNENSFKIAEKLGFQQVYFYRFKNFTRRVMILG